MRPTKPRSWFTRFAKRTALASGRPSAFFLAVLVIVTWAVTGPLFHYSDTWQLVINTGTTIITFLIVFLIQNTQNRDSEAVQLKLDELIRASADAHNALLDIEELSEEELNKIKRCYTSLARDATAEVRSGKSDLGTPAMKNQPQIKGRG